MPEVICSKCRRLLTVEDRWGKVTWTKAAGLTGGIFQARDEIERMYPCGVIIWLRPAQFDPAYEYHVKVH